MNDPVAIGALFTAWSTIMVAMYRRTNGTGPLAKRLDQIEAKMDGFCERVSTIERKVL